MTVSHSKSQLYYWYSAHKEEKEPKVGKALPSGSKHPKLYDFDMVRDMVLKLKGARVPPKNLLSGDNMFSSNKDGKREVNTNMLELDD